MDSLEKLHRTLTEMSRPIKSRYCNLAALLTAVVIYLAREADEARRPTARSVHGYVYGRARNTKRTTPIRRCHG